MEKGHRSLVRLGIYKRFPSKAFQPNQHVMRDMILNLMAIVGFIFLGLVLLHLFVGTQSIYAFYAYIGIFILLESSVIAVRFYMYLKRRIERQNSYNDEEDFITDVVKSSIQKSQQNSKHPSYDSITFSEEKAESLRRNSL